MNRNIKRGLLALGLGAFVVLGSSIVPADASALAPAPVQSVGNITVISNPPRFVPSPGDVLTANTLKHIKVAGATFGSVTVPDNATGVSLNVSNNRSGADGQIRVSAKGTPRSGSATISWVKGQANTASVFVAIGEDGSLTFESTSTTNYLVSLTSFTTPVAAPAAPVVKTIAPVARKVIEVGGSFRARSTDLGEVTLAPGTYDARVLASFQGLNNLNNTVPAGVSLTGTVAITLGDEVKPDFSNNITVGGIAIPRSQSDTLTQDPTGSISTFFTLTEATDVHVRVFAYASNSSQAGSGELKAGLDSATFVKLS